MCGIAGVLALHGDLGAGREQVQRMVTALAHRGPDGEGVYADARIALGHRRLAVIDPSDRARQPMISDDGRFVIVLNGEIYNYRALRADLERRGHRFASDSDTEVLLRLYQEQGPACLDALRGMFAFAVWDASRRSLFLARDRVGKKPLVFGEFGGVFYFASELKALLTVPEVRVELDPGALLAYFLNLYVPYPLTIYRGVEKLPPGTAMLVEGGRRSLRRYWVPDFGRKSDLAVPAAAERFVELLEESVRLRMVADVPVGALLSGGVDSSAVVAMMTAHATRPVRTFSVGFSAPGAPDPEFEFARAVAERFGTEHREILVEHDLGRELPALLRHTDEPFGLPPALHHFVLAREVRRHVTVALTGDGGDELFGGYPAYNFSRLVTALQQAGRYLPLRAAGSALGRAGGVLGARSAQWVADRLCRAGGPPELVRAGGMEGAAAFCREHLFAPRAAAQTEAYDAGAVYAGLYQECRASSYLDGLLYADLIYTHQHSVTVLGDLSGMAHGLEFRAPFLDHRMVEFAAALPVGLKVPSFFRKSLNKYVVKRGLSGVLPPRVLGRRKMGFGEAVRYDEWMRGAWRPWVERVLFDGHLEGLGFFQMSFIRSAWQRFLTEPATRLPFGPLWICLWQVMIFDLWARIHLEGQALEGILPFAPARHAVG